MTAVTTAETVKITTPQSSATPAGLMAFALNFFLLCLPFAKIGSVPLDLARVFVAAAIFFGIAQMICGFFEYRIGAGFLGLTFVSFGVFWVSTAFFFIFQDTGITTFGEGGALAGKALGVWLIGWGLLIAMLWWGSYYAGRIAFAVFTLLVLVVVFFILGSFSTDASSALNLYAIGAWLGIVDALLTFYFAAALFLNEMTGKTVLRVF